MAQNEDGFFGMSDDDFAKLSPSVVEEGASAPSAASKVETPAAVVEEEAAVVEEPTAAEIAAAAEGEDDEVVAEKPAEADAPKTDPVEDNPLGSDDKEVGDKPKDKADPAPATAADPKDKPADPAADPKAAKPAVEAAPAAEEAAPLIVAGKAAKEQKPEALAAFFDKVMAPIKANGKDIRITSPDDVIRLMQMGAGYGKKIQDMQPHVKSLRMLEKNGLLSEDKLSYLIDLDKKNPEAIKKLIKESGIDPLDLNIEGDTEYTPTNHSVSDNEINFRDALTEVQGLAGGKELIQHINKDWDQKSKDHIFETPAILKALQQQRESGVYTVISDEIDRQKMMGIIPHSTPFLEAYKIAGDHLVAERQKTQPATPAAPAHVPAATVEAKVLATRTAAPKPAVSNSDKAKAAASPQANRKPAKVTVNPLDMADDEFIKTYNF